MGGINFRKLWAHGISVAQRDPVWAGRWFPGLGFVQKAIHGARFGAWRGLGSQTGKLQELAVAADRVALFQTSSNRDSPTRGRPGLWGTWRETVHFSNELNLQRP